MDSESRERLVRIETKLDAALTIQADHEKRIRSAEKKQWLHSGALMFLAPILSRYGITLPH